MQLFLASGQHHYHVQFDSRNVQKMYLNPEQFGNEVKFPHVNLGTYYEYTERLLLQESAKRLLLLRLQLIDLLFTELQLTFPVIQHLLLAMPL